METQEGSPKPGFRKRIVRIVGGLRKGLVPAPEKIQPDKIDEHAVANTIFWNINNPLRERLGMDQWANPFTIVDVLANMGYVATWHGSDYRQKFPEVYQKTRTMLQRLADRQALTIYQQPLDANNETLLYKVTKPDLLKDLANIQTDKK